MQPSPDIIIDQPSREYRLERLCPDTIPHLAQLHAAVYGAKADERLFREKYDTAYTGLSCVGYLAYDIAGTPIAFYGVIPCRIWYRDQWMLAAQSADTMTHPQYRLKGMFVELSEKTFALCRHLGIPLLFGFPNRQSYHGAIHKLGWKMTEEMVYFKVPARRSRIGALLKRYRFLSLLYQPYCRRILRRYSSGKAGIANSVIADGWAGLWRNDEFLGYKKYSDSIVLSFGEVQLWLGKKNYNLVGDIAGITSENASRVFEQISQVIGRLGFTEWQFHGSPGTALYNLFAKRYAQSPSYPALFQDFGSPISPEKIKFTFADIDIF